MHANIVCPGPSVILYRNKRHHLGGDVCFAVNRAVLYKDCEPDFWCVNDWVFYRRLIDDVKKVKNPCNLLTTEASMHQLVGEGILNRKFHPQCKTVDEINNGDSSCSELIEISARPNKKFAFNWMLFTVTSAIMYAHKVCGADVITLYGADMSGSNDWDGYTDELYVRNDNRWTNSEGVLIAAIANWLERRGVALCRLIKI